MIALYPAIDLKNGQCVRLVQGRMDQATVFNPDPVAQAQAFVARGAKRLHLVDLDGAFAGESINGAVVRRIIATVDVPLQLGGGIRDMAAVESWLTAGLSRVIIGSAATQNPAFLCEAAQRYPHQISLGLDTQDQQIMINGWAEGSGLDIQTMLAQVSNLPLAAIIHTDIARDGMKAGVNYQATDALGAQTAIPVIASGGLASLADLHQLNQCHHITGVISGRALYDGSIDLVEALRITD